MIRPAIAMILALSFTFMNPCSQASKVQKPLADEPIYNVTLIYPKFISVPKKYNVPGLIDVTDQSVITANAGGEVEQVYVSVGDSVLKDDPLVTISNKTLLEKIDIKRARIKEYQAKLSELQVRIDVGEGEDVPLSIDDTQFLDEEPVAEEVADKQFGDASDQKNPRTIKALADYIEKAVERMQKEADALDRSLLELNHNSPVDGVVTRVFVTERNNIKKQDSLVEVSQTSPLSVTFALPQETASFIDKRSSVTVTPEDADGVSGEGMVYFISPNLDASGKIEIRAHVTNEEAKLKGAQKAVVSVSTRKMGRVVVLPKNVLHYENDKVYVFVGFRNQAKLTEVSLGDEMEGGNVQVHGDLRVDDPIIIERPVELKHNSFIKMTEQGAAVKEKIIEPVVEEKVDVKSDGIIEENLEKDKPLGEAVKQ